MKQVHTAGKHEPMGSPWLQLKLLFSMFSKTIWQKSLEKFDTGSPSLLQLYESGNQSLMEPKEDI